MERRRRELLALRRMGDEEAAEWRALLHSRARAMEERWASLSSGGEGPELKTAEPQSFSGMCAVCMSPFALSDGYVCPGPTQRARAHTICRECITGYLSVAMADKKMVFGCPGYRCNCVLDDTELARFLDDVALGSIRHLRACKRYTNLRICPKCGNCQAGDARAKDMRCTACRLATPSLDRY